MHFPLLTVCSNYLIAYLHALVSVFYGDVSVHFMYLTSIFSSSIMQDDHSTCQDLSVYCSCVLSFFLVFVLHFPPLYLHQAADTQIIK